MYRTRPGLALLLLAALLLPEGARAAVRVNEIAWMGSASNANAEWIELYNDGEATSLEGWKLASGSLNISLSGSIAAQGYYLLERTSDESVPSTAADKIYTGALSNSGDTLVLKDGAGAVIDTVAGGTNWTAIGGDNTTKHTAQRSGSGWVTAAGTPRAENAATGSAPTDTTATTTPTTDTSTTTPTVTVGGSTPSTASIASSPARTLFLDIGDSRIVLAGVPTPYEAVAYDSKGKPKDARVTWNFGDGARELGDKVWHAYEEPGEYAVVARATLNEAQVIRTLTVVVEPASVAARMHPKGVQIENASDRLIDLSGWRLMTDERTFVLPEDTVVLPNGKSLFPSSVTGLSGEVYLSRPKGEERIAAAPLPSVQPEPVARGIQQVQTPARVPAAAPLIEEVHEERIVAPATAPLQAAAGAAVPPIPWFSCLFGNLLACSTVFVVR